MYGPDTALFQFLIGRLGTPRAGQDNDSEISFQFLIGRLGTMLTSPYIYIQYMVSIPHR